MQITNPFSGSKVKISRKITRKYFDENPDKFSDYKYDVNKDCDSNEYYQLQVNSQDEYLLIRENERSYN